MKKENVKWELGILLNSKKELRLVGRDLEYHDDNRIKKLQDFLDAEEESNCKEQKTETKTTNSEIPF
jgi:hypothetical protein